MANQSCVKFVDKTVEKQQGFSTIEFIIGSVMMTFIIFFPIAAEMQMHTVYQMEQELNRTLQMAAVQGGITPKIQRVTIQHLEEKGIEGVAFTANTTFSRVPRGKLIHVGIVAERPRKSLYRSVMALIGGEDIESDTFTVQGTIMSERLQ
ncbi:MAG TPA: hypothetical protein VF199_04570 [Bacillales bacterium]